MRWQMKVVINFSIRFFILVLIGATSTAFLNVAYCQGANKTIQTIFLSLVWIIFMLGGALIHKSIINLKNGKSF